MLKVLKSLRDDRRGVVSFEYIIVAACIIATVGAVFLASGNGSIKTALNSGITAVSDAMTTATGGTP